MNKSDFWDVFVPRAMSIFAGVIFAILWLGFITALLVNRDWLDSLWVWVQALPWLPRIIIWLVFLPIMTGLWIWQSSWSTFGHLLGLAGIIAWTLVAVSSLIRVFKKPA